MIITLTGTVWNPVSRAEVAAAIQEIIRLGAGSCIQVHLWNTERFLQEMFAELLQEKFWQHRVVVKGEWQNGRFSYAIAGFAPIHLYHNYGYAECAPDHDHYWKEVYATAGSSSAKPDRPDQP